MPDLNDFHAFNSTSGGSGGFGSGGWKILLCIAIVAALLILLGECSS